MKKIVLALAAVAVLAGCQKPEVEVPVESNDVFTASVEEFGAQTKTALASGNHVVWSAGDHIAIFQGSTLANEYEITESSAGKANATFTRVMSSGNDFYAGTELPCNVAFYPYAEGLCLEGDMSADGKKAYAVSTVLLPAVQMYEENSFANGTFPMVAVTQATEDHNLNFKNVLGAMKLSLKGSCVVKSIKVEGANGEKLSGAATVTAYAKNLAPTITMAANAATEVTLDCGEGVQLSESEVTNFYIALPPVLFEKGFTVTVTDVKDNDYTVSAGIANTILRSSILVMPEVIIESEKVDYVDEYGINHGPGVAVGKTVWAPVNCGYHATDYQWGKFYQWGRKYGQGYDGDATTPVLADGGVTLEEGQSEHNKNVFYMSPDFPYDWLYSPDGTLWNSGSEDSPVKTEYDPCPKGWRVPTYAELNELYTNRSSWTKNDLGQRGYWFSGLSSYSSEAAQVFFPAAGGRYYDHGYAYSRGYDGHYWSSRPDYYACSLGFNDAYAYMYDDFRAHGHSVRCVQDASGASAPDTPENDDELIIPVSYVNLNSTSLNLYEGDVAQLTATVGPKDATDKTVIWSSNNAEVAVVDQMGRVMAVSAGSATISAVAGGKIGTCSITVTAPAVATADYVDEYGINHGKGVAIGMAVWAPVNCGYHATDYQWGKLYQWGRKYGQGYDSNDATTPELSEGGVSEVGGNHKSNADKFYYGMYDWVDPENDNLWNNGSESSPVKTDADPCPEGWRVPTYAELSELRQNHSSWTTNTSDQPGYWFSGASSYTEEVPQVFFPAAGYRHYRAGNASYRGDYGYYWSSSPYNDYYYAYGLCFCSGFAYVFSDCYRAHGYSVRCVQD